jgi:hypothetical protein
MPHPLAAYPLLSVAGRGEPRRFLPEAAVLLPRGIPARLRPRSFPYPGESRRWAPWLWKSTPGRTDWRAHTRTQNHACTLMACARAKPCVLTHTNVHVLSAQALMLWRTQALMLERTGARALAHIEASTEIRTRTHAYTQTHKVEAAQSEGERCGAHLWELPKPELCGVS